MLRLFFAFHLLVFTLFACQGGYESCKQKIIDSQTIVDQSLYIPINKTQRLVYSTQLPEAKVLKADPFLALYLVQDRENFPYPFSMNINVPSGYASVNAECATEGIIKQEQIGLNHFAVFNEVVSAPSLLLNSCCSFEGIVTPRGIIAKEYIENFLNSAKPEYADIGIRVQDRNATLYVAYADPFWKENPFMRGDILLRLDNQKIKDAASFMKSVLFAKPGTLHTVKLQRDHQVLEVSVKSKKRYGGGFLSDTFLEQKGIYFDENLAITKLSTGDAYHGLKLGDKLVSVNGKSVNNQQEIMKNMPHTNKFTILLFQRDDFQFFIRVK